MNFKRLNSIVGWIVFAIAAYTYIATAEPTASLWDCGEFIATSYKLEVGHPPGAPFFMILMKIFSLFAGNDVTKVAYWMNIWSALASAFTILFLFWSITYFAKKIITSNQKNNELTIGQIIAILGSGVVGALAYTFSDSFWFSAVEAEVYATSSLFTALVFWLILKWDEQADEPHSYKWIVLIALLMGISIGVHLLNLLVIPAIGLIIYFKKYKPTILGIIATLAISFLVLLIVMYGIVQGLIQLGSAFELLFVNGLGLPFNSGLIFYLLLLLGVSIFIIWWSYKKNKVVVHTAALSFLMLLIGYSSFAIVVIRSNANPPIDENNPEDTFSLKSYLNREQYGDRPLIFGQYYNADPIDQEYSFTYIKGQNKYIKVKKVNPEIKYDPASITFFPRMFSNSPEHIEAYKAWGNIENDNPNWLNNMRFFLTYQLGWMYFRYFMWNFAGRQNDIQGHGSPLYGNWQSGIKFLDNIRIPQNNLPDKMKNRASNNKYYLIPLILGLIGLIWNIKHYESFWTLLVFFVMTGIAIVVYLNQTPYQPRERDYAYVGSFYVFAIWIGFAVLAVYDFLKKYLNDTNSALIPSIAFLSAPLIMAFQNWDDHNRANRYHARDLAYNYLMTCDTLGILFTFGDNDTFPLWYAQETEGIRTDVRNVNLSLFSTDWYADQMRRKAYESDPVPLKLDRSKYLMGTRDVIYVYENPNVLFKEKYLNNKEIFQTKYENLYKEALENLSKSDMPQLYPKDFQYISAGTDKTDIEIVLSFFSNLKQVAQKIKLDQDKAEKISTEASKLIKEIANSYADINDVMNFALSDSPQNKLKSSYDEINYIPTTKISIRVDTALVKKLGFVKPEKFHKLKNKIYFTLNNKYLLKAQWLTLKMIADNNWQRPIYFAIGIGDENYLGLQKFFRLDGFAYRLMPYEVDSTDDEIGEIDTDILYDKLINIFKWGNVNADNFNVDHFVERQFMVLRVRTLFHRLAKQLIEENKPEKALVVLDRIFEIMPDHKFTFDYEVIPLIEDYYRLGEFEKGNRIAKITANNYIQNLNYFKNFRKNLQESINRESKIAIYVLQNIYSLAHQYKQDEIVNLVKPILAENISYLNLE